MSVFFDSLRRRLSSARGGNDAADVVEDSVRRISLGAEELDLVGAQLTDSDVHQLCAVMRHTPLQVLNLNRNQVTSRGCCFVAEVLPETNISRLFLVSNKICGVGVSSLCEAIPRSHLQVLYLGSNLLEDADVLQLAAVLPSSVLKELDLSHNHVSNMGGRALAAALTTSLHLRRLFLHGNRIGTLALNTFIEKVPDSSLQVLSFTDNPVADTDMERLEEVMHRNRWGGTGAHVRSFLPRASVESLPGYVKELLNEEQIRAELLRPDNELSPCVVCMDRSRTTRLSCGHQVCCLQCARKLLNRRGQCPVCRTTILSVDVGNFGRASYIPDCDLPKFVDVRREESSDVGGDDGGGGEGGIIMFVEPASADGVAAVAPLEGP